MEAIKPRLTVFTPTYNRAHTLERLYRSLCVQTRKDFVWLVIDDGSTDNTKGLVESFADDGVVPIIYRAKENGGLYTAYNVAYEIIDTELNVCIDSDDYMPDNAVELILDKWEKEGTDYYAGMIGLDFYAGSDNPIGGYFPRNLHECFFMDLYIRNIHRGDTKQVMRTELMKKVAPQIGFDGEKNFNPVYMLMQVCDKFPLLIINENLCFVEYRTDGMANNIFRQYKDSPHSFAKMRLLEMNLGRNSFRNKYRCAVHYAASCMLAGSKVFTKENNKKLLTFAALLPGLIWYWFIRYKNKT